jgi:hypothetical protein
MQPTMGQARKAAAYLTIVGLALVCLGLTLALTNPRSSRDRSGGRRIVLLPVNGAPHAHSSVITTWSDAKIPTEDGAMLKKGCLTASYYVADVKSINARHAAETSLAQVEGTTLTGWQTGSVGPTKVMAADFEHGTVVLAAPLRRGDFAVLVATWHGCTDRARVAEVATSIKSFRANPADAVGSNAR